MIYLDNAATTIYKPQVVVDAVAKALCTMGNSGRGVHDASLGAARIIFDARSELADFFHAENPGCIAFTSNATQSLNIALKGLLNPGDHVITTVMEHNSVLRPLYTLEQKGVSLTILPCDRLGKVKLSDFKAAIRPDTKMIVCTHASNLTGNMNDLKKIGEIAHRNGLLFVVDASQSAGVYPIDVQEMQIDVLCFTGHKSLLGPQGTGGLYVRPGVPIRPLIVGGSGSESYNKRHPEKMPTALEAGTLNGHGIAGLGASIRYLKDEGLDGIREKELNLMWTFYHEVVGIPGVTVYGDFSGTDRCPIVSLNIWDYDSARVSDVLYDEYRIAVRAGAHCAPLMHEALGTKEQGAVRFSFSHYNTIEEVQIAADAIRELAKEGR